jgi:hypothetical protein
MFQSTPQLEDGVLRFQDMDDVSSDFRHFWRLYAHPSL